MSRAPLSRPLPRRDQRARRLSLEPLEDRRMLDVAPLAVDDAYETELDTPLVVQLAEGVLANDSDPQGDPLTAVLVDPTDNGILVFPGDGSFAYVPNENFVGVDTFMYRASDGVNESMDATVVITVGGVNDPPLAVDDLYATGRNGALVVNATEPGISSRIYESTQRGASNVGGGSSIDAAQFLGSRFFVDATVQTERIGGQIAGNAAVGNGMLFAAVVALSGPDDFPDSVDLSTPDVLGHTLLTIDAPDFNGHLIAAPLDVTLTAGWYAIVYGSGRFGATGGGSAPWSGIGGHEQLRTTNGGAWTSQVDALSHFFLDGQAIPGVLVNDSDAQGDPLTASLVDDVENGALEFNADGTFTYTPGLDFVGTDTFTYRANDGVLDSNLATVTIDVVDVNVPPTAGDDAYSIDEDGVLDVDAAMGVLSNDDDANETSLTATLISGPNDGTLQLNLDGSFIYTPNDNFFGEDRFTYVANDGEFETEPATVTITVNPQPDAPVATGDVVTTFEDTAVSSGGLLPGLDLVEWSANGHFYALVREQIRWEAARDAAAAMNYRGAVGHLATITSLAEQTFLNQNVLNTITGEVFVGLTDEVDEGDFRWITGEPFNFSYWRGGEPNNANNDDYVELQSSFGWRWNDVSSNDQSPGYIVEFEPPFANNLLLNDSDVDGDPLTVILDENDTVEHGVLDLSDDGTFTYTPEADFFGSDTFSYRASDGVLQSELATVTITVEPVNDAPVADDDGGYELGEDGELIVDAAVGVLVGDTDVEDDPLTAELVDDAEHGTVALAPDGSFSYTPDADFFGEDRFTYVANDGELDSELATVTITVNPIDDLPVAVDDAYELNEDASLVTTNLLAPSDGLVHHWTFDEAAGEVLTDAAGGLNGSLVNWGASEETWVDGIVGGALDMGDADNFVELAVPITTSDTYTISVWSRLDQTGALNPRIFGWLLQNTEIAGGVGIYHRWQSGQAYAPSDPVVGQWEHYALVIDRIGGDATIYRDGVAVGTGIYRPNAPESNWLIGHMGNPADHRGSWLGALDDLRVYDRMLSAQEVQNMYVAVMGSGGPGVLLNDSDADGDELTATLVDNVQHGTLELSDNGTFTYTPEADFFGTDTFTYRASDGALQSELATVTITVLSVNDAPVADDDGGYELDEDGELAVDAESGVLVGDMDAEDDPLTSWLVDDAQHGSVSLAVDGSFNYTPNADFFGEDTFTYVANDGELDSQLATVTITVNPIDDPPVAVDDEYAVDEDVVLVAAGGLAVTANDEEPDGDALAVTLVDDTEHGALVLAADGTFVYTPGQNFNGNDSFTYFVNDGTTQSNVATATITVTPVNDPPVAVDDAFRVPTSGSLVVAADGGLLTNDSDVEDDPLVAILVAGPAHGELLLADDGSFEYTPDASFDRQDSFTYRAGDGQDLSEITTVTLTLDAPLVVAGDHVLRANTPGQTISILVSGEHDVSGLNLFVQIGDGGPELVEFGLPAGTIGPRITAVDLKTGTIFAGVDDEPVIPPGNLPQVVNLTISLTGDPATVEADGILATLTIDTTGLFGGEWDLLLSGVLRDLIGGPFETDFAGAPAIIESGMLRIVPAEVVDRHVFYNGSVFDGRDAAANEDDDSAIAPDKTALLPGNTATLANYTSFAGGITGLMLDVERLLVPEELTADDFSFRSGQSNDPSSWQPVDAPASVTVRSGAGTNGSARITLTWPAGTIEGSWLEVTLKSNATTGLPTDDVFYFGSAVGESGDKLTDALVNATDVIAVRDNPRGPLNQAPLDNRLDFNRDALVNATDLVLARDHITGPFTALQLITPLATGGAASPVAAGSAAPQAAAAVVAAEGELPTIVVGDYTLAADTPNQQIEIFVSGGQLVSGVNLAAQVGDGGPELATLGLPAGTDGPAITSADLKTGTIFAALDDPQSESLSLPQARFSFLGIASQNTTVSADGLLVTLTIDTTGIFGGSFALLLSGVLPQMTNGPFTTDFAGLPAEISNGVITVLTSRPADLTGDGWVDFQDLTILLAHWDQMVSAGSGNLVDPGNTPINFQDLTFLLAAWTGPGPVDSPQPAAVGGDPISSVEQDPIDQVTASRSEPASDVFFNRLGRREARRDRPRSPLGRLQSTAVDRAIETSDEAFGRRIRAARR
ncbi:MAG: tandem-95 repeat protein [Planctomycetes bacterium]|nr:tandem-95 repeat protein [Planctomycetota bacterium]